MVRPTNKGGEAAQHTQGYQRIFYFNFHNQNKNELWRT